MSKRLAPTIRHSSTSRVRAFNHLSQIDETPYQTKSCVSDTAVHERLLDVRFHFGSQNRSRNRVDFGIDVWSLCAPKTDPKFEPKSINNLSRRPLDVGAVFVIVFVVEKVPSQEQKCWFYLSNSTIIHMCLCSVLDTFWWQKKLQNDVPKPLKVNQKRCRKIDWKLNTFYIRFGVPTGAPNGAQTALKHSFWWSSEPSKVR